MKKHFLSLLLLFFLVGSDVRSQTVTDTIGNTIVEISVAVDTTHFQGGYDSGPWDLYWGPDNKLWYTNQKQLCRYDPVTYFVDTILTINSGFIMGVATHRDFFNHPEVYLTIDDANYYGGGNTIRLFKYDYDLSGNFLFNPQFLLLWNHGGEHSGGRVIHGLDDKLYVSTAEYFRQNDTLFNNSGKVLRVNTDGSVPSDNPRADYTYTYGHRNPQGIVQAPNGNIFISEYGQSWDELNLVERNGFYGWMIYDGVTCIGNQDSCDYYDTTAVFAIDVGRNPPSGIDYYSNFAIPEFFGLVQAVTGALAQGIIVYRLNPAFDSVVVKTLYLTQEYGRVRDVCTAPDGSVYFIAWDRVRADIRKIRNPLSSDVNGILTSDISLYPNPVSSKLNIRRINYGREESVQIVNCLGKIVYSNSDFAGNSVDVSSLAAGVYLLKYSDGVGSVTKSFVVSGF